MTWHQIKAVHNDWCQLMSLLLHKLSLLHFLGGDLEISSLQLACHTGIEAKINPSDLSS